VEHKLVHFAADKTISSILKYIDKNHCCYDESNDSFVMNCNAAYGCAQEKMTMVIVTHEMAFARDVANHVIFMDQGYIVEEGAPEEVFGNTQNERTKQFLQRYNGGEPPLA